MSKLTEEQIAYWAWLIDDNNFQEIPVEVLCMRDEDSDVEVEIEVVDSITTIPYKRFKRKED